MAAMVPRSARMASTGVMVLRRLLEPALSLLRVSGGVMSVIIVVRTQHSVHDASGDITQCTWRNAHHPVRSF